MLRKWQPVGVLLLLAGTVFGCGPGKVQEKTYEVKQVSALDQAKGILENYAKGQPMGSEAASFPQLVEEVRKTDPEKAKILEKGFADLQKSKSNVPGKAKAILKQL